MTLGAGEDINYRFTVVLIIGSVTGIIELIRNIMLIWAKHAKYQKLEVAFSILGFITTFMITFNFILMNVFLFDRSGQVCVGANLTQE